MKTYKIKPRNAKKTSVFHAGTTISMNVASASGETYTKLCELYINKKGRYFAKSGDVWEQIRRDANTNVWNAC